MTETEKTDEYSNRIDEIAFLQQKAALEETMKSNVNDPTSEPEPKSDPVPKPAQEPKSNNSLALQGSASMAKFFFRSIDDSLNKITNKLLKDDVNAFQRNDDHYEELGLVTAEFMVWLGYQDSPLWNFVITVMAAYLTPLGVLYLTKMLGNFN